VVATEGWSRHPTILLGFVAAFAAVATAAAWPWWEYAFLSDDSPLAWLSSALLLANAAVAMSLTVSRLLPARFGWLLTAALAYLAIDEQFQLHERMKELIGQGRFAELPTWLIGAGGVVCLFALMRIARQTSVRLLIIAAVSVGIFALWVDLGKPATAIARTEELYEVIAETLFLAGLIEVSRAQVQSGS
jgi:hypothetical protein